jgi:hypothetical protein
MTNKKTGKSRPSRPQSLKPQTGGHIRFFVGKPLDFSDKIRAFRAAHPGMLDSWDCNSEANINLYAEITREIRRSVLELEMEAWGPLNGAARS